MKPKLSLHLLLLTILFLAEGHASSISGVDRILVLVNDEVIMKSELEAELTIIVQKLQSQKIKVPPIQTLAGQVLEKMITEQLQMQDARKAGILVDESTTDRAMESIARRNKLSLSQFKEALQQQGTDYLTFRENLKQEITLEKLRIKRVENKVNISNSETKRLAKQLATDSADELRQYRLGHILIPLPDGASPEQIQQAKNKALQIAQSLEAGADFKQTALERSAGAQALEGGILDWRTRAELPTLFARQLPGLTSQPFVGPVRSASGFHLLSLLESREQSTTRLVTLSHARHILIKNDPLVGEEKIKAKLEILRERILSGESFEELALTNSEDGSAKNGGDLGWQNPENLVPEFVKEMDKLEPDELSPVFKTRYGWHIVQMVARKQKDDTETYLLNQARQMIRKRKISEATETWQRRLRDEAYIEYRLDDI